jgi:hypothetical protein
LSAPSWLLSGWISKATPSWVFARVYTQTREVSRQDGRLMETKKQTKIPLLSLRMYFDLSHPMPDMGLAFNPPSGPLERQFSF